MDNEKFGSFIKQLRQEKGVTQKQLSEALGITGGAVSKWERGLSFPDITLLSTLADYFGVSVTELMNGERGDPEQEVTDIINHATAAKIKAIKSVLKMLKKLTLIFSPILMIALALLQAGYLFILKPHGYEYIYNIFFSLINALFILISGVFVILKTKENKSRLIILTLYSTVMLLNIALFGTDSTKQKSFVSISPNLKYTVTVKVDRETGGATLYRNTKLLLFAKPKERLENDISGDIKMQWLEKDICTIVYRDSLKNINSYIATFGARGGTVSYDYVAPSLLGDWTTDSGKKIELSVDNKGITVKSDGNVEFFQYSDCKQYGTTALVLKKDSVDCYNIALNYDCRIDKATGIIRKGGTITLSSVSCDKTVKYKLRCTTPKKPNLNEYKILNVPKGGFAIKNGVCYVSYDGEQVVELPYPSDEIIADQNMMTVKKDKIAFVRTVDGEQHLIISDNSGTDWYTYKLEVPYNVGSLQFINEKCGFMFEICDVAMGTARGRISKTIDGGANWTSVFYGIETLNGSVFKTASEFLFVSEEVGFFTMPTPSGDECLLFRTLDGAKTFAALNLADGYDCYTLPKVTENGLEIKVSGGNDQNLEPLQKTFISTDGGKNFTEKETNRNE